MNVDPQFHRTPLPQRQVVPCSVDGNPFEACAGDTVLSAVLAHRRILRPFEFANVGRSGFCLMGACQDCWVHLSTGERIRACTTLVSEGMCIVTNLGKHFDAE